jgi:hypothetical protein
MSWCTKVIRWSNWSSTRDLTRLSARARSNRFILVGFPSRSRIGLYDAGFRPRTTGRFLCLSKETDERKDAPVVAPLAPRAVPCASRRDRTRAELAERENHALRAQTPSRESHRPRLRCSACSRGTQQQPTKGSAVVGVVGSPMARLRAPPPSHGLSTLAQENESQSP